jgi:DNA-binding phage protein
MTRNICVTTWRSTIDPRTGAERYFKSREADSEYADALAEARATIDAIDSLIRSLDERRIELDLSKAEVARRAHMKPEAVRRLFSAKSSNPTITTLVGIATALDIQVVAQPKPARRAAS